MLGVDPEHHRKGVGQRLILKVEQEAKKHGANGIALETQKKASWAVSFYKKQNYLELSPGELTERIFTGTLSKPPLERTYVFGKKF